MKNLPHLIFFIFLPFLFSSPIQAELPFLSGFIRYQEPDFMTFEELKVLSEDPYPGGAVEEKLKRFWKTPIISNEAYYNGAKPIRPGHPALGPLINITSWNIEKSFNMAEVLKIFSSAPEFESMIDPAKAPKDSVLYQEIIRQRSRLLISDVLILQEMDIGVKRSNYINAAAELAKKLNMNYAYGTEQLEIDPITLGTAKVLNDDGSVDEEISREFAADPNRYKGAFGCAVLSRYPIKHVEVFQLHNQPYDWFWQEKTKTSFLEKGRRIGTKALFKNELEREMKVGGRIFFRVDLYVPELPQKTLTIINIHLEIKAHPKGREEQMREILSYIKEIKNPVVVMGDFNAAGTDLSPTSVGRTVKRTAKNPTTWFQAGVSYLSPYALAINTTRGVSNVTKNFQDPFASHIPVIAPNPVKKMFQMIYDFEFYDGTRFDFRGDGDRSINGKSAKLSNSNQRDFKGFKTTFQVKRPLGPVLGKLRLDWVFVKSFLTDPEDEHQTYRFAPHFGETLEELNTSVLTQFSDHHPNIVDLPFQEPNIEKAKKSSAAKKKKNAWLDSQLKRQKGESKTN
jgi:endonuclease/exonuclease/phosphatase family metal-dependent hydrolase